MDCDQYKEMFPNSKELELMSTQSVWSEFKIGERCFVILTYMEINEENKK